MIRARALAGVVASLTVALIALLPAQAAAAAPTPSEVAFESPAQVAAEFGTDWVVPIVVSYGFSGQPATRASTASGTIDVYASGVGGAFATGLPIQEDGRAYVSQPDDLPLLAAGDYSLTAVFIPGAGGGLATSQTASPVTLTITPVAVAGNVEMGDDPAVSEFRYVSVSLTGDYVDERGGAPAGTWNIALTRGSGSDPVFEREVAVSDGATKAVVVEISEELRPGTGYELSATFTPVPEYAGGLTVTQPSSVTFETAGETLLDIAAARTPLAWWLVIGVGVLLVGLIATVVVLGLKLSRRNGSDKPEDATSSPRVVAIPTESDPVESSTSNVIAPRPQQFGSWSLSADSPTEAISLDELGDLAEPTNREHS